MSIEQTLERIAVALELLSGITPRTEMTADTAVRIPEAMGAAEAAEVKRAGAEPEPPKRRGRAPKAPEAAAPEAPPPEVAAESTAAPQEITIERLRSALVEYGSLTSTDEGFKLMATHSGAKKISDIPPERRWAVYQATLDAIRAARKAKEAA